MDNPLIGKLETFTRLSPEERAVILHASTLRVRHLRPREDLVQEDQRPRELYLILDGWAARYKMLVDGRRQTLSVLIPGDLLDVDQNLIRARDHSIAALTALRVAEIPPNVFEEQMRVHAHLLAALRWSAYAESSIQREWILNLGQRNAIERIAHLLCELVHRLRAIGQVKEGRCDFPLTQADIGDATGLTVVHVNRTLQELRRMGLISLAGKELVLLDEPGLMQAGLFSARYLHLGGFTNDPVPLTAA